MFLLELFAKDHNILDCHECTNTILIFCGVFLTILLVAFVLTLLLKK